MPFADAAHTWNRRFAGDDFLFGTAPNAYLESQAHCWRTGERILCVADGEGRNSVWLAHRGFDVQAFDVAEVGVAKARALAARAGVRVDYQVIDCDRWPWQAEAFDGVAAIFVQFADPPMRQRLFDGIVRTLKPGGMLVLQGYAPKQLEYRTGGPGQIDNLYTEAQLRRELGALEILSLTSYEAEIHEGQGHHGQSALIGLVARKP